MILKRYQTIRWFFTDELINDRVAYQLQIIDILDKLYLAMKAVVGECKYKTKIYLDEDGGVVFYIEED